LQISTFDHVLFRELDGEAVLLDLEREQYFGLNELGTRVWKALHAGSEVAAIVTGIAEEFDIEPEQVRSDVEELIEDLKSAQLIEVREDVDG